MSKLAYRPEIDGLRAIAVAAVVLYHLEPSLLPGGFAGVDVFFVLSGYLITSLLAAEWRESGRIDLMAFYARRMRRLMPALWLVVGTVMLASVFLLGHLGEPFHRAMDSALASLTFLANFYFLDTTVDYFGGPADQLPLLHLWSLAVEEQFYLVFPLLLGWLLARGGRVATRGLWLLSVLSLLLAEHWLSVLPEHAFFHMPARFWELAAGALVALSPGRLPDAARSRAWLAALGLALVAAAMVTTGWHRHFPGTGALPAVLGTAMVLYAGHVARDLGPAGRLLSARPMVLLGLWSYSLYLWHWPLLALDRATRLSESPLAWRAGLCLLALGLAALTYRFVEQPVRRGLRLPPRQVLIAGLAAIAVLAGAAHGLGRLSLVPPERAALVERTRNDRPPDMSQCHYPLGARIVGLAPAACPAPPGQGARLAIWGDSHALAWRPFAETLARAAGQAVQPITMDACAPLAGATAPNLRSPTHAARCDERNELALAALSVPGAYDRVVIVARWSGHVGGAEAIERLQTRLTATLDQLAQVPEVIVVAASPELAHAAPTCIASGRTDECAVPRASFEAVAAPVRAMLVELAATRPHVTVIDPGAWFCESDHCPVLKDGVSLYWDDDHVSSSAARAFAASYLADPARYTLAPIPPSSPGR